MQSLASGREMRLRKETYGYTTPRGSSPKRLTGVSLFTASGVRDVTRVRSRGSATPTTKKGDRATSVAGGSIWELYAPSPRSENERWLPCALLPNDTITPEAPA